ncbi:MAG: GNAT family N-acetyltransferase [Acidobacteriota bacterium]
MIVLNTARLQLRHLDEHDADFIVELLNDPSFLRFIGDKGVRTREDATRYILEGPRASYEKHGFGLYLTALTESGERIGICGLVKRDALDDVDIGFAFLPSEWGRGYALEAAGAVMQYGWRQCGLPRIVAITQPDNRASISLLLKLGMRFDRSVRIEDAGPELALYTSSS